jgi:CTP-dependent riboflavin kinase
VVAVDKNKIYKGIVRTGRGGAVSEMSKPCSIEGFKMLTGLEIIPGTLNILLIEAFDLSPLKYLRFADVGWEFNPATQGIDFDGEIGVYYSPVTIANKHPGCILFFTWTGDIGRRGELVSPHHLRTVLGLNDGDTVEFTLED